jgi:hypothetical protein
MEPLSESGNVWSEETILTSSPKKEISVNDL